MRFTDALRLIDEIEQCRSSQEVGAAFASAARPFGFLMVSCGACRETPSGPAWEFFFNTWPADFLREYQMNDYVRYDPVPAVARLTTTPFTWRELLRTRTETPKQAAFSNRIRELGIVDGFAVPIHQPGGDLGLCVSVANKPIEDREERLALHLASFYVHERCSLLRDQTTPASLKSPLSPRELECLKWVLDGKSDTDIGVILGISHTTVHFHIERVKRKLGVRTRTQAAAMVMTLGYL